jgi:uncharacterized protein (UPF0333 family)
MQAKKTQITMEFLLLIGFIFIITIGFIIAAGIQMKNFSDESKKELVKDFGLYLKKEIDVASVVKDGYKREISLPEKIDGKIDYSIMMENYTLIVFTDVYDFSSIVAKTNGTFDQGKNIITKINGTVIVQNEE